METLVEALRFSCPACKVGPGTSCHCADGYVHSARVKLANDVYEDHLQALQEVYKEGPTCSICDALGHGYPGGGPCPLEESPLFYDVDGQGSDW